MRASIMPILVALGFSMAVSSPLFGLGEEHGLNVSSSTRNDDAASGEEMINNPVDLTRNIGHEASVNVSVDNANVDLNLNTTASIKADLQKLKDIAFGLFTKFGKVPNTFDKDANASCDDFEHIDLNLNFPYSNEVNAYNGTELNMQTLKDKLFGTLRNSKNKAKTAVEYVSNALLINFISLSLNNEANESSPDSQYVSVDKKPSTTVAANVNTQESTDKVSVVANGSNDGAHVEFLTQKPGMTNLVIDLTRKYFDVLKILNKIIKENIRLTNATISASDDSIQVAAYDTLQQLQRINNVTIDLTYNFYNGAYLIDKLTNESDAYFDPEHNTYEAEKLNLHTGADVDFQIPADKGVGAVSVGENPEFSVLNDVAGARETNSEVYDVSKQCADDDGPNFELSGQKEIVKNNYVEGSSDVDSNPNDVEPPKDNLQGAASSNIQNVSSLQPEVDTNVDSNGDIDYSSNGEN